MSGVLRPLFRWCRPALAAGLAFLPAARGAEEPPVADWRNIRSGLAIPSENYADQPYVVVTQDGHWLCTLTTGRGREGERGQHVVATISRDKGKTWSELIAIEPADGPEASWVTPLAVPGGRVYALYTYNADNLRQVRDERGRMISRVDTLGKYVFRHSDDGGRTWSAERHEIPIRTTEIDRGNPYGGEVKFFWSIAKPIAVGESVFVAASKVANFGRGFLARTEGFVFRSDNLLTESDAARVRWAMLPEADAGLRAPAGPIAEEHNLVALADGSLYGVARTTQGWPVHYYSRDGGRTWTAPAYATYAPGGRRIRHPRACPRIWRTSRGRFLLWFHNHGGKAYEGRNPAWISGGIEKDGFIHWSEPEILLYDDDPATRISYPDLIEQDGRYWVTETQKTAARVHEIAPGLLEGVWNQHAAAAVAGKGLVLAWREGGQAEVAMPRLPDPAAGGGFAVEMWLTLSDLAAGQVVLNSRDAARGGVAVTTTGAGLRLDMGDGRRVAGWDTDPGLLRAGALHHVVFIVDGGPKLITVVVDGRLCDGGEGRQYGWGRFQAEKGGRELGDVTGGALRIAPSLGGRLRSLRIYDRYLRTSEAVGNFRAGPDG